MGAMYGRSRWGQMGRQGGWGGSLRQDVPGCSKTSTFLLLLFPFLLPCADSQQSQRSEITNRWKADSRITPQHTRDPRRVFSAVLCVCYVTRNFISLPCAIVFEWEFTECKLWNVSINVGGCVGVTWWWPERVRVKNWSCCDLVRTVGEGYWSTVM